MICITSIYLYSKLTFNFDFSCIPSRNHDLKYKFIPTQEETHRQTACAAIRVTLATGVSFVRDFGLDRRGGTHD